MVKITYVVLMLLYATLGFGQAIDSLQQSVVQNNPRLTALEKWLEAEEKKTRTGIYPNNPQVSFNYLWGSPEAIGNQQEIEVTQSFKLLGFYNAKSAIQKLSFQEKQSLAEKEKREILHLTRSVYFNLVWLRKMATSLKVRNEEAENLVAIMKEGLDRGEISKPVYNKARIYAIGIKNEWQRTLAEIEIQTQQLYLLNGEKAIDNLGYQYPFDWAFPVLDSILVHLPKNNPDLLVAQLGIERSQKRIKQQWMSTLPSFEIGYKSETILSQKLQGIHLGITIPLWQNANRIKQAKLQTEWSKANFIQQENQIKTEVTSLYNKALALRNIYVQTKVIIEEEQVSTGSLELLKSGQISFSEYLMDTNLIWTTKSEYLKNEKEYFTLFSKLKTLQ